MDGDLGTKGALITHDHALMVLLAWVQFRAAEVSLLAITDI